MAAKQSCDANVTLEGGSAAKLPGSATITIMKPANVTDPAKKKFTRVLQQVFIPKEAHMQDYFGDIESIGVFATTCNASLEWINCEAKRLRLVKTLTGRSRKRNDRVGFGLSTKVSRLTKCPRTLFKFGLRKNGLFHPSK